MFPQKLPFNIINLTLWGKNKTREITKLNSGMCSDLQFTPLFPPPGQRLEIFIGHPIGGGGPGAGKRLLTGCQMRAGLEIPPPRRGGVGSA